MAFYRTVITAVAAMGLATSVFAAEETQHIAPSLAENTAMEASTSAPAATKEAAKPAEEHKVDVNKATVKELAQVKGLSHAKARVIVNYRKKHGDFKSLDEIREIKVFKKMHEEHWKKIEEQLSVG